MVKRVNAPPRRANRSQAGDGSRAGPNFLASAAQTPERPEGGDVSCKRTGGPGPILGQLWINE
jgi:hypothetical protein